MFNSTLPKDYYLKLLRVKGRTQTAEVLKLSEKFRIYIVR